MDVWTEPKKEGVNTAILLAILWQAICLLWKNDFKNLYSSADDLYQKSFWSWVQNSVGSYTCTKWNMSEDLYGPGISDENEVATILLVLVRREMTVKKPLLHV